MPNLNQPTDYGRFPFTFTGASESQPIAEGNKVISTNASPPTAGNTIDDWIGHHNTLINSKVYFANTLPTDLTPYNDEDVIIVKGNLYRVTSAADRSTISFNSATHSDPQDGIVYGFSYHIAFERALGRPENIPLFNGSPVIAFAFLRRVGDVSEVIVLLQLDAYTARSTNNANPTSGQKITVSYSYVNGDGNTVTGAQELGYAGSLNNLQFQGKTYATFAAGEIASDSKVATDWIGSVGFDVSIKLYFGTSTADTNLIYLSSVDKALTQDRSSVDIEQSLSISRLENRLADGIVVLADFPTSLDTFRNNQILYIRGTLFRVNSGDISFTSGEARVFGGSNLGYGYSVRVDERTAVGNAIHIPRQNQAPIITTFKMIALTGGQSFFVLGLQDEVYRAGNLLSQVPQTGAQVTVTYEFLSSSDTIVTGTILLTVTTPTERYSYLDQNYTEFVSSQIADNNVHRNRFIANAGRDFTIRLYEGNTANDNELIFNDDTKHLTVEHSESEINLSEIINTQQIQIADLIRRVTALEA